MVFLLGINQGRGTPLHALLQATMQTPVLLYSAPKKHHPGVPGERSDWRHKVLASIACKGLNGAIADLQYDHTPGANRSEQSEPHSIVRLMPLVLLDVSSKET